jgi:hypothetical protein
VTGGPLLAASGAPAIGAYWRLQIEKARASSSAFLTLGNSSTTWGAIALPWAIPNAPGCFVNAAIVVAEAVATDANGEAGMHLRIPAEVALIRVRFWAQGFVADPVNALGVVSTRGADASIGGLP